MTIWFSEIKELEKLYESFKGHLPDLEKELVQLIRTQDSNVIMLYSRRCLEVIITDLCERELKRPRKTEPLKGIIDKLNSEEKVPAHIITSMHGLNSLSTYGAHPKDFDPEQVKPVLNNLAIVIKWYLKHKESLPVVITKSDDRKSKSISEIRPRIEIHKPKKWSIPLFTSLILLLIVVSIMVVLNILGKRRGDITKLEKSIAVLPFQNDSPNEENSHFVNSFTDEIRNNLQKINIFRIIDRKSSEYYNNLNLSPSEIAKKLDVNYLVQGSGLKLGDIFRLRVQLILASKGIVLWSHPYQVETKETKELFAIYIKIAEEIAAELKTVITIQEKQLIAKLPTADLAAYDAYLKGQVYWRKLTQNDLQTAMSYFELAKKIDPDYALAYAGICDGWMGLQQMGIVSPAEAVPKAEGAIMKALELDSTRAEVKYSLALIKTWGKWDWQGGESAFKKAIAVNPNFSEALAYYSHLLNILGRPEEAIRQIETALSLDPINPLIKSLYGMDLLFERRYDDAILAFQDALNIDPTQRVAKNNLPTTLHLVGRDIEALEAYKSSTNNSEIVEAYKVGYTKGGFAGAIRQVADLLEELSKTTYIRQTDIADKYALCGDKDKAIKWLENGFQNHDPNLPYLLLPKYDSLRDDSRFQDLCRRMNLQYK